MTSFRERRQEWRNWRAMVKCNRKQEIKLLRHRQHMADEPLIRDYFERTPWYRAEGQLPAPAETFRRQRYMEGFGRNYVQVDMGPWSFIGALLLLVGVFALLLTLTQGLWMFCDDTLMTLGTLALSLLCALIFKLKVRLWIVAVWWVMNIGLIMVTKSSSADPEDVIYMCLALSALLMTPTVIGWCYAACQTTALMVSRWTAAAAWRRGKPICKPELTALQAQQRVHRLRWGRYGCLIALGVITVTTLTLYSTYPAPGSLLLLPIIALGFAAYHLYELQRYAEDYHAWRAWREANPPQEGDAP